MADDDVGSALTGWERYMKPSDVQWGRMRQSGNIEDRQNEEWPTASLRNKTQTLTQSVPMEEMVRQMLEHYDPVIPPITSRLQQQAGTGDVAPPSAEEMMKFIIGDAPQVDELPMGRRNKGR